MKHRIDVEAYNTYTKNILGTKSVTIRIFSVRRVTIVWSYQKLVHVFLHLLQEVGRKPIVS